MNFKIEINYLDITNYPSIEKHFEEMARQGWLIKKVIAEKIFIYKKIEPEKLDFLIRPYKVETGDSKRIKGQFEDFQSEYKTMGWNYITKSSNLHICFKGKDSESINLESDDKEKFKIIEKLAGKQLIQSYIITTMIALLIWFLLSGFISDPSFIQNGWLQAVILLVAISIIIYISEIVRIQKFLKVNRQNVEKSNKIEYSKSKFYIKKAMLFFYIIFAVILVIYLIYVGIILKNSIVLFGMLYVLVMVVINTIILVPSKVFIKENKKRRIFETIMLILYMGLIVLMIKVYIPNLSVLVENYSDLDLEEFRVLSNNIPGTKYEEEARIYQNISLFVPKSYEYGYFDHDKRVYIGTEYSDAINEDIAKTIVNMYKKEAKHQLGQYEWTLGIAIEEDNYRAYEELYKDDFEKDQEHFPYEKSLEELGMTLEEFNKIDKSIKHRAIKEGIKILEGKAIEKDKENLWNLEEVYFLSHDKSSIVIREGKEVFYLEGKDFSDPDIIKQSKEQLDL